MKAIKIDLNEVVKREETEFRDVDSVDSYIEELVRFSTLIEYHIGRCKAWDREPEGRKKSYGALNTFLETLEGLDDIPVVHEGQYEAGDSPASGKWTQELEDAENIGH